MSRCLDLTSLLVWFVQKDEEEQRVNEAKAARLKAEKLKQSMDPVKEELRREAGLSK
jgi:hypothetical protein